MTAHFHEVASALFMFHTTNVRDSIQEKGVPLIRKKPCNNSFGGKQAVFLPSFQKQTIKLIANNLY